MKMIRDIEAALKYAELQLVLSTNDTKTRCFRTIISALRAELDREKNPLTWNERINQMTVEEKVLMLNDLGLCLVGKDTPISNCKREDACTACLTEWLNSPYTKGEADEG